MMKERFIYLLDKHKNKTLSETEKTELTRLLVSNQFDEILQRDIAHTLTNELSQPVLNPPKALDSERIIQEILTQHPSASTQPLPVQKRLSYFWWAAAAAIVLGLGIYLRIQSPTNQPITQQTPPPTPQKFTYTNKEFIYLPDGSTVLLNSESTLTYFNNFKNQREIFLSGEAFFDIKKDPLHPFIIHTGDITTKVLGTAFNINSHNDKVIVTVTRGMVQVEKKDKILGILKPNQQISVNKKSADFQQQSIQAEQSLTWKANSLIMDDITFTDAIHLLEKRFKTSIKIENTEINDCRIRASFLNDESLDEILTLICGARQAEFEQDKNQIIITGGYPCK